VAQTGRITVSESASGSILRKLRFTPTKEARKLRQVTSGAYQAQTG
jgi:hypothetical protein